MANNYTLGRGEMHLGQFKPGTQTPRGERYLGNTPELGYTAEQESLDHYSSDFGIRQKDQSVTLQLDYSGSFITDNISPANLAMMFLGEAAVQTVTGGAVTGELHKGVEQGLSYQLGTSATTPSGARKVSAVTIKDATEPTTTFTAGTDYVLDPELGRFTILKGGAISDEADLSVDYTVDASTRDVVISRGQSIEGSLRYIAKNPAGEQIDYFMPWVKITPNGDFALKSDEWQQLPFNIEILKKGSLEAIYMDGRPYTP